MYQRKFSINVKEWKNVSERKVLTCKSNLSKWNRRTCTGNEHHQTKKRKNVYKCEHEHVTQIQNKGV